MRRFHNPSLRTALLALLLTLLLSGCFGAGTGPIAVLSSPVISGPAPLQVTFDLSLSVHPRGQAVQYEIEFGDESDPVSGAELSLPVVYTYHESGTYEATLHLVDEKGRTDSDTLLITVNGQNRPIGIEVGNTAPDFTAHTTDGGQVTLSDHRGSVVLLEFWGAWCPPCRRSMPHLHDLVIEYADRGLVGIIVSTDPVEQDAIEFLQTHGYTQFISVWEPGGKHGNPIDQLYQVTSYPTTFILDRQGVIRWITHPSSLTGALIEALL
jgi:peroxiredoxin